LLCLLWIGFYDTNTLSRKVSDIHLYLAFLLTIGGKTEIFGEAYDYIPLFEKSVTNYFFSEGFDVWQRKYILSVF